MYFEFLDDIGIRQRNIGRLSNVVVSGADSVDQVVVVVLALTVDDDAHVATPKLSGSVQFALCAAGESQELLIILRGEGQFADGLRSQRLSGGGIRGFDVRNIGNDFDLFRDGTRFERDGNSGGFGDTHFDTFCFGFGEAGFVDHNVVGARRQ